MLSVLHVSHFFQFDQSIQWAVGGLERLTEPLPPSKRLWVSRKYQVQHWILPAVDDIIEHIEEGKKIRLLTRDDIHLIGVDAYALIVNALERMQVLRISVSLVPPKVQHAGVCQHNQTCRENWERVWITRMPSILLSPNSYTFLASLPVILQRIAFSHVPAACKALTLEVIEQLDSIILAERSIKDSVATSIWDIYKH